MMPSASLLSELTEQLEAAAAPLAPGWSAAAEQPLPPPATVPAGPAAPSAPWRPVLQVDRLNWPDTANRLEATASGAIDAWAEAVNGALRSGRKVLGFGSSSSGEGVTTLMLVAARRLAGQGLRVAVVDANLPDPKLAQALGLLPEVGWEASLSAGLPLEEVAVESITDRLTVVPLLAAPAEPGGQGAEAARAAADLETLAKTYDAVLLDLGGLEADATASPPPAPRAGCPGTVRQAVRRRVDAVLLVHSVRATTPDRIDALQRKLAEAGIAVAGIVQNFVAG
jgi:Mrp family chromosome partitioning ATPase